MCDVCECVCVCVWILRGGHRARLFFVVFFYFRAASRLTELALSVCDCLSLYTLASPDVPSRERVPGPGPTSRLCSAALFPCRPKGVTVR